MRKLFLATLLLGSALMVNAQSGTNSPYSQYGLGILSDQTSGFNRGMNGVGLGFHEHNQVNYLNPASYASIDSMTFILDAGISGQVTNFEENGVKKNANNSNFEYVVAGFRLLPHVGMSFGIIPFTNVGYNYSASEWVNADKEAYYTNTYSGDGGLHQAYIGAGWEPVKGLAVGANFSYLWGSIDRSVSNSYSNSYYKTLTRYYSMQVNSYKVDFGVQYIEINIYQFIANHVHVALQDDGFSMFVAWSGSFTDEHITGFIYQRFELMSLSERFQKLNHVLLVLGRTRYFVDFCELLEHESRLQFTFIHLFSIILF